MATIILSAVGTYLGGPVGGAIGSFLGQQIDAEIFRPKAREGPRLSDLSIQSSRYGNRFARHYGAVRAAGTVIWATDLKETRSTQSNGKGAAKTKLYSYSASFAVGLASRPITRIGRIWADGNILRGAAGDFKVQTGFRVHLGSEDQPVDPLIAAIEGAGNAPAYRGLAYVVFEDLPLASFGNRIPSLSFEIFADDGPVTIASIADDLAGAAIADQCPTGLRGFSASRGTARGSLESLNEIIALHVREAGGLQIREATTQGPIIAAHDLGADAGETGGVKQVRTKLQPEALPRSLALTYADPARDYQAGEQSARWVDGVDRAERIELPATLSAGDAARTVRHALSRRWSGREQIQISLPMRYADLLLGQLVSLPADTTVYRITKLVLENMTVKVRLVRDVQLSDTFDLADPGRHLGALDTLAGQTRIALLDLPTIASGAASAPQLVVAASGTGEGWRSAALLVSQDGGNSWVEAGSTARPAIMGSAVTALGPGQPWVLDLQNTVEVQLQPWMPPLPQSDEQALLNGANPAMLGDEIILFGSTVPIGNGRYRLSRLIRGLRGTEAHIGSHMAGERFVMLEADSLSVLPVSPGAQEIKVMAQGLGDATPVEASIVTPGAGLKPLSPVHITSKRCDNGDIALRWIRRSRDGWHWHDLVDVPLVEEAERYVLTITLSSGATRELETTQPSWVYTEADQVADRLAGASFVIIAICQIGTYLKSRKTEITNQI